MHRALAAVAVLLVAAACGGGGDDADADAGPGPPAVRLDQVQLLATHNSYHLEVPAPVHDALAAVVPDQAQRSAYSHRPLGQQLDGGVRGIELDVFEDPEGGRYARPVALERFDLPPLDERMSEPGFKVLHQQETDFASSCPTLQACLGELRTWSDDHPGHAPVVLQVEVKDGPIADVFGLGFVQPLPATSATLASLEDELRAGLGEDDLVLPAEVQGTHPTLRAAVEADGWPALDDLAGRFVIVLDDHAAKRQAYRDLRPTVADRLLFVDAAPPDDDAAYVILNDPVRSRARITELVRAGFLVRTRADEDTLEARTADPSRARAALASGAQIITTDYPVEDRRHPGYVVELPGGRALRCNPVTAPEGCDAGRLERLR